MSAELARHRAYLQDAVVEARQAMLSRRRAMLAGYLLDAFADRLFYALGQPAGDILAFRADLAASEPALGHVFDLAARRTELAIDTVDVPLAEYGTLGVADFMVSLYNQHTVQRLRLVTTAGERLDVHAVLADAMAAL